MPVGEVQLEECDDEKLLGATLDKKFSFRKYVQTLCKKGRQKLHALTRISIYIEANSVSVHDRNLYNKTIGVHERARRIAHKNNLKTYY